jgi:hypothetical protein
LKTPGTGQTIQTGSIRIIPDPGTGTPAGVGIFTLDAGGVRVSEAGVPIVPPGTRFRIYAEATTGIAITNTSANPASISFTLMDLQGRTAGNGALSLPANGQTALFVSEIPGLASIPAGFQGILQIAASEAVSLVGLRGRYNERGDFLITTIPGTDESASMPAEQIFPHLVDGGGYTTQVILHTTGRGSPFGSSPQVGILRFINQSGEAAPVNPR